MIDIGKKYVNYVIQQSKLIIILNSQLSGILNYLNLKILLMKLLIKPKMKLKWPKILIKLKKNGKMLTLSYNNIKIQISNY